MCEALPGDLPRDQRRPDNVEMSPMVLRDRQGKLIATAVMASAPRTSDPAEGTSVAVSVQGVENGPEVQMTLTGTVDPDDPMTETDFDRATIIETVRLRGGTQRCVYSTISKGPVYQLDLQLSSRGVQSVTAGQAVPAEQMDATARALGHDSTAEAHRALRHWAPKRLGR